MGLRTGGRRAKSLKNRVKSSKIELRFREVRFKGSSSCSSVLKEIINSFLQKNYKNAYIKKSPYFKGYRGCGKLSDVLEFTSNATHMQQVCNKDIDMYRTFFSRNTGECPFLHVSTSGATDSK